MNITDDKLRSLFNGVNVSDSFSTMSMNFTSEEYGDVLIECVNYTDGEIDVAIYFNGCLTEQELCKYQKTMIKNYMDDEEDKIIEGERIAVIDELRIKDHI
tara:strand:+ start:4053 stop:4355 length:303 start_codon:yes stop_codon:yes gene_type:complete